MHMDPAGFVYKGSPLFQFSHDLLNGDNVLIPADGAYHFRLVFTVSRYLLSSCPFLRINASVTHKFPLPPLRIQRRVGIIIGSDIAAAGPEVFRRRFRRGLTGDACHLDLDPKSLFFEIHLPSPPLSSTCLSEQPRLVFRCMNHQVITLIAAFIETHAPLWVADQVILTVL